MLSVNMAVASAEEGYTPTKLKVDLYTDGAADVEYSLDMDSTLVRVNVALFGSAYENLMITDSEGVFLDFDLNGNAVNILTLGSDSVKIIYSTSDLTDKSGSLWAISMTTSMEVEMRLPMGATIMNLNPVPRSIVIVDGRTQLTLPAGAILVSYVQGSVDMSWGAREARIDARDAIKEVKIEGVLVGDAEEAFQAAEEAFSEEDYYEAQKLFEEAMASALAAKTNSEKATIALGLAERAINAAIYENRKSRLNQAEADLDDAYQAYSSGDYLLALSMAEEISVLAGLSTMPFWDTSNPLLLLGGSVALAYTTYVLLSRRRIEPLEALEEVQEVETVEVDIQLIFKQHPYLRLDDKEVIRYLVEVGGGAFAAELRQRFDLPKSSAWRMIRRLERDGIVETRAVGRETFVEINPVYSRLLPQDIDMDTSFQMVPEGSY
jgi:uncharacterized membrane protein